MVANAKFPQPITVDEYIQRGDDEPRAELIDGEIVLSPEPTWIHQRISLRIARGLSEFSDQRQLGEWFPPLNVVFSPSTTLHPDLVFMGTGSNLDPERPLLVKERPRIVLEILSPSNRRHDLVKKRSKYAEYGVPEYWIVDPEDKTLVIGLLNQQGLYDTFEVTEDRIPLGIFEGATLRLSWVFDNAAP